MTQSEINEAVARKLGWKKFDEHYQYWIPPTVEATHRYGDRPSCVPLYCQTIAAAFEIVEFCNKRGKEVLLRSDMTHIRKEWECSIGWNYDANDIEATADTAPMAICLAFLKLTTEGQ